MIGTGGEIVGLGSQEDVVVHILDFIGPGWPGLAGSSDLIE